MFQKREKKLPIFADNRIELSVIQDYGTWHSESCSDTPSLQAPLQPKSSDRWISKREGEKDIDNLKHKNNISKTGTRIELQNGDGFQVWEKTVVVRIQFCDVSGIQKCSKSGVEDPPVVASGGEGLPNSGKEANNKNNTNKNSYWLFTGPLALFRETGWKDKASLTGAETTHISGGERARMGARVGRQRDEERDWKQTFHWKLKWNLSIVSEVKIRVIFGSVVSKMRYREWVLRIW